MFVGPVFSRELATAPRRPRLFVYRAVYAGVLFGVMCTAWFILTGTQVISSVGDMATFGGTLFQLLAPLQLSMVIFIAALSTASAVSQEKDRKTLILLLLTQLNNSELVLGRLFSSLLHVATMILAGLPVFAFVVLFGGVSFQQVMRVFLVTAATALVAGSLGSTLALWREKTFQTLALTALVVVFWLLGCEAIRAGAFGEQIAGVDVARWSVWLSPIRAITAAARPGADLNWDAAWYQGDVLRYVWLALAAAIMLNGVAILRVRIWNPSREVRRQSATITRQQESIWGAEYDLAQQDATTGNAPPAGQTDASAAEPYREVWNNPILWRESRTWAYGRKILVIRFCYLLLFTVAVAGVMWAQAAGVDDVAARSTMRSIAGPAIPFFVVSLVIINALAVTSITTERDGRALDLLLVTDLTPKEFLFGKLGGVAWITKEMILLPVALCLYLLWSGDLSLQNFCYCVGGLLVLDVFVGMLGIHCGMTYANSRAAIGVSLGTVFFLFLGIATCIVMMISFSGAFQVQLAPFLAFIVGGAVGLYVSLGARNPSPAILLASLMLPFATFYAITSFLMEYTLAVFLVMAVAYSFTTAAMMIPALAEFDFAMGRNSTDDDS